MSKIRNSNSQSIQKGDTGGLDKYDVLILRLLRENSKASLSDLSERVGLSRFAVKDRIERLFENGAILGSTVVLNPLSVGLKRTVFFEFKTNPHEPWLAKLLEKTPTCDLLDGITGEYSLFGRFRMTDDQHFTGVLRKIDEAMSRSSFKKYRVVNAIRIFKEAGVPFVREEEPVKLDDTDMKILEILLNQVDYVKAPRLISTVELSGLLRDFGMEISQPAVFKRLARLEKDAVILRYVARVNHSWLGAKTKLIVRVKVNPNAYNTVARDFLAPMPEVTDLYRTGEEYGLLAFVRVGDAAEFNSLLLRLYGSKDVLDTYTTLVLEERKNVPLCLSEE